jgi:nucleotide-binding universal stress UspA family protein
MGALTQDLFTMIVAMAVATTMAMPPMLRWALARVPMRKAEKERLEREEFEGRGFVSNLERLLLAVDQSPNGKFAAALAGHLAGTRGIPITLLPVPERRKSSQADKKPDDRAEGTVKAAAEDIKLGQRQDEEAAPVDVTVREHDVPTGEAVAQEAKKGYDLLFVGLEDTRAKGGAFHEDISHIASAFDGPLAIVAGNGDHLGKPQPCPAHILVPVTGNEVSRRAAEVAIAIARACDCPITALYVATTGANNARKRRDFRARRQEQAIIKDIVEIADSHDVKASTAVRSDLAPRDAILGEAKKRGHDLIVMGVSRRSGDKLFFGDTAAAVLDKSPASIMFVAS